MPDRISVFSYILSITFIVHLGYGLDEHAKPSQLHRQRSVDDDGNFIRFNAYSKFSQNIILEVDVNEGQNCKIKVVPIDLDLTNQNPIKRGLPNIPNSESAKLVLKRLNKISQPFNTKFFYDEINNNFSTIKSY